MQLALQIEASFQKCKGLESEIESLRKNLDQMEILFQKEEIPEKFEVTT